MKKQNIYKLLYLLCALLILGFCIRLGVDYFKYDGTVNSAPFCAFVLARAVEFIVPGIAAFVFARILKNKYNK